MRCVCRPSLLYAKLTTKKVISAPEQSQTGTGQNLSQNFTGGDDAECLVRRLVPLAPHGGSGQQRDALVLARLGVEDVEHGTVEIV